MRPTTALLTTLTSILASTTAAAVPPPPPPPVLLPPPALHKTIYPGGYILLSGGETIYEHHTEFQQQIDLNRLTPLGRPSGLIAPVTSLKFSYFVNVEESKVRCHAFLDEEGLKPFGVPFAQGAPLELKVDRRLWKVRSVLCLLVV
jgi:hypothetical protein